MVQKTSPIYCLDVGQTTWKVALAYLDGPSIVLGEVQRGPSRRSLFTFATGFSTCVSELLANPRVHFSPDELTGIACAIPFGIDYRNGWVDSEGRAGWPEHVEHLEATCRTALGLEHAVVLNDAVAYALGHRQLEQAQGMIPPTLYLTLGTFVGAVWSAADAEVLQPVEVSKLLAHQAWPDGTRRASGTMLSELPFLHRASVPWTASEAAAYSQRIGWVLGALLAAFPAERVVFGGGRTLGLDLPALEQGVSDLQATVPQWVIAPQDELALRGAAVAWRHQFLEGQPISSLIGTGFP